MIFASQALREIPENSRQAAILRSLIHTAYVDPAATFNAPGLDHNIVSFQFTHREGNVDQWFTCTWMLALGSGLVM